MEKAGRASVAIVVAALFGAGIGTILATRPAPAYTFLGESKLVESDHEIRIFEAKASVPGMVKRVADQYPSAFQSEDQGAVTMNVPRRVGKRFALVGTPERSITVFDSRGKTYVRIREFYSPNQIEVALDWMRDKLEI